MIKGAALKANNLGMGLVTFMTFTFDPQGREEVAQRELVIGTEMRRTLNAMQQRFRRQSYGDFAYIWVAENPGDSNPHVHLLTNHKVPRSEFEEFAAWVESLWGHGWAKIERIRKPEQAGHYILKAIRYALKGEDGNQGTVYGNRYGISKNIRTVETTIDIEDREDAAHTLRGLLGALPEDVGIDELAAGVYRTRYGLSFVADTSAQEIERLVDDLEHGAIPMKPGD